MFLPATTQTKDNTPETSHFSAYEITLIVPYNWHPSCAQRRNYYETMLYSIDDDMPVDSMHSPRASPWLSAGASQKGKLCRCAMIDLRSLNA